MDQQNARKTVLVMLCISLTAMAGWVAPASARAAGNHSHPATMAAPLATIRLTPPDGHPGTRERVDGQGFGASELVAIFFDQTQVATATSNLAGKIIALFNVPSTARPGRHRVKAVGQISGARGSVPYSVHTDWTQFQFDGTRNGFNPYENVLDASNVSGLTMQWTSTGTYYPAVVARGVVYVQQYNAILAFSANCGIGGVTCSPLWQAPIVSLNDTVNAPLVADGMIIVGGDTQVYAFQVGCGTGGATCTPAWIATIGSSYTNPVVGGHTVYATGGLPDRLLYAFPTRCGIGGVTCTPLWTTPENNGGEMAVAGGYIYVGSGSEITAFSTGCSDGCLPSFTLSAPIYGYGTFPATIVDGELYSAGGSFTEAGDLIWAFPATCAQPVCGPDWYGFTQDCGDCSPDDAFTPVVADGMVFAGGESDQYPQMAAFAVGCGSGGAQCSAQWWFNSNQSMSAPAVANGLVYVVGDNFLNILSEGGTTIAQITIPIQAEVSGIAISDGRVILGGTLFSLTP